MTTAHENGTANRIADHIEKKRPKQSEEFRIAPLKQAIITIPIIGTAPLKVLRFSKKKQGQVAATQAAGSQSGSKKKREAKDFEGEYEDAKYLCTQSLDGKKAHQEKLAGGQINGNKVTWLGLNASGIRNGCIETCRVAGYVMTKAKMSVFAEPDGFDDLDQTPLVRILGEPEMSVDPVRNANGVIDLRSRVMFREWKMNVRIRFDEDQFSPSDVINLVIRLGQQNGLGEGRPNGSNGNGTGNGLFLVDVDRCSLHRLPKAPEVFEVKEAK